MTPILALVMAFTLSFHPSPRATSYTLEKQTVLDSRVWTDIACGVEPCSLRTYNPAVGIVEQVRVRAINKAGSSLSANAWTLLTLDWSGGRPNYSTYTGNGGMQGARVKVLLPSPRWTVVYSFQGAIPVYVKATCDHDYNRDDVVNLLDLYYFAVWYYKNGGTLSDFAMFGNDYQQVTREWR